MRQRLFCLILAILLLLFPASLPVSAAAGAPPSPVFYPGASLRFEHLALEDGLSQNAGLAILQDSRGYMWFGTQDGLNRYDGSGFTVFKTDPDDPASISHNSTLALLEDPRGYIWIGTWGGGLNRFDPQTSSFKRYQPDPKNPASLSHGIVTSLALDAQGRLWVGTLGGLDRLDPATDQFTHFRHADANPASLSSDAVSALLPAADGSLWVGTGALTVTGAGLNRLDMASGAVERIRPRAGCLRGDNISSLALDAAGALWVGSGGYSLPGSGIDRLDPAGGCAHYDLGQGTDAALNANNIIRLLLDNGGQLWAATWGGGLARMDTRKPGVFTSYRHDPANLNSISNDTLFSLYQDRSDVLWVGSLNSGLNKLNLNNLHFRLYERSANGLTSDLIGGFAQTPDGRIWIASWDAGLFRFDESTGVFEHFPHDAAVPGSLASDLVLCIQAEQDGTLWAGTLGAGLDHFDPASANAVHYVNNPSDPASLVDNNVVALLKDPQGRLWVGTMKGLDRLDPGAHGFVHYRNFPGSPASLSLDSAVSLALDGSTLRVGTWGGGLNQLDLSTPASLDPVTARFSILRQDPANPRGLPDDNIWVILKTAEDTTWLGTQSGLVRWNTRDNTFKAYREKDGLRNTTVLGIVQDDSGDLWMTTDNGLARFNPPSEKFTIYDVSDGLQSNEFNTSAYFKSANGSIYIGGSRGFNVFTPAQIQPNPVPPPVVITGFKIFNTPQKNDLSGSAPLKLNYDQNFISFEFAALDYQAPRRNQYAYKLEGFDRDWVVAGTRNYASYTNLPGGEYTFHVRAANSDGIWNESGAALPLSVTPPVWQMWQFQLAAAAALALLLIAGFQWRVRAVRQQNIQLGGMIREQQRVETELREAETRFRAMYDNAAVGMAMMSLDRKIISINQRAAILTGYTLEELVDTDPTRLSFPEDIAIGREDFADLVSGKIPGFHMEKRFVRKNGEMFWGRVTYSQVPDKDGRPEYLVGVIEDISRQREADQRLAEQEAEYRRTLEKRVEERTHALAEANLRLLEEIEQRKRVEEALATKAAEDAVAAERTRLARDLHDAVTQTLFAASLIAEVLPELWAVDVPAAQASTEELRQMTRGALAEMRTLLLELRPSALTQSKLSDLIRQLCEALIGRARLPINLTIEGDHALPPEVQVAFYRIAQETLNNVFKYARATRVDVSLFLTGVGAHLEICDNGVGFDLSATRSTSLGLRIMRERAEAIGAELAITSQPGKGATIDVDWIEKPDMKLSVFKK